MFDETKNVPCNGCGTSKHIKGIHCDVKNCVHHGADTYCTAEEIQVGPGRANTSSETLCVTFREKNEG